MSFAIIGKWNNQVQEVRQTSLNLTGIENVYEVETSTVFNDPLVPNTYEYLNSQFRYLPDFPLIQIDRNWRSLYADYKLARVALYIAMMTKGGFDALDTEEKQIASKWFIVGRSERNQVHTVEQQVDNGLIYNAESINARRSRMTKCMIEVYNRLTDEEVKAVMAAMDFSRTTYAYVEAGQEGTLEGNEEGLFDYIEARTGTTWQTTGLRAQLYIPVGYANCGLLADRLMDILVNGNY